jgi:hypothetical protein
MAELDIPVKLKFQKNRLIVKTIEMGAQVFAGLK